ncbi:MAG: D-alanyl-D-alanine carboxypeptidase [Deltaproteobacteria bacterium]|nr:D-alanyl-D-alanine carboxypeptidase [Deltaproteobacteria bacterium]
MRVRLGAVGVVALGAGAVALACGAERAEARGRRAPPKLAIRSAGEGAAAGSGAVDEARDGAPVLGSKSVLVVHGESGRVLLARGAAEQRSIASLTKLMAALVVRDRGLKLDEGTTISRDDWKVALNGCRTRLELNWTYRNRDLLRAALMSSDNRAVSALGRAVGLDAAGLVRAMNERARRMGLKQTRFVCPVGIEPGNVSTAFELSRIVREASQDPVLRQVMGTARVQLKPMRGYLKPWYANTNPLVGDPTVGATFTATKTGFNHQAGYCLATVARLPGLGTVTVVLLGARRKGERIIDLRKLLRWVRSRPRVAS